MRLERRIGGAHRFLRQSGPCRDSSITTYCNICVRLYWILRSAQTLDVCIEVTISNQKTCTEHHIDESNQGELSSSDFMSFSSHSSTTSNTSLTRLEANGLRILVEGVWCSCLDLSDSVLASFDCGEDLVLEKHILIVLEGGFSLSSLTSFLFVDDLVNCKGVPLCRFILFGSDNGPTHSAILHFGSFSLKVLLFFLCSDSALLCGKLASKQPSEAEPGLGVDLSHFSKMNREFLGVTEVSSGLGEQSKSLGVEETPTGVRFLTFGLSRLEVDVHDKESAMKTENSTFNCTDSIGVKS